MCAADHMPNHPNAQCSRRDRRLASHSNWINLSKFIRCDVTPISLWIGTTSTREEKKGKQSRSKVRIRLNFMSICVINEFDLFNCRHSTRCAANVSKNQPFGQTNWISDIDDDNTRGRCSILMLPKIQLHTCLACECVGHRDHRKQVKHAHFFGTERPEPKFVVRFCSAKTTNSSVRHSFVRHYFFRSLLLQSTDGKICRRSFTIYLLSDVTALPNL